MNCQHRICLLVFALGGALSLAAAEPGRDEPVSVIVTVTDRAELEALTRLVSIDDVRGREVRAVASPRQLDALRTAGYVYRVVPKTTITATMCPDGWASDPARAWDCYPTYGQYVELMERFATEHPALCRLESIGSSTNQGRPHELWVLKISDDVGLEQDEPEVFLTSTMHGDETTGYFLMLRLADELLGGHGSDPEITALVNELEIWVNPLANPDGAYLGGDHTVSDAIRYYATSAGASSWVDPNRNFPDPDEGDHPDGNPWWAETEAMMDFAAEHSFVLSANFHGGAELVNYPWDTWSRRHADDEWLIDISRAYADRAQADGPAGYLTDRDNGITNGWDWYAVAGGRQDFMTFWHGSRELTLELSLVKLLPAAQLPTMWDANRRALLGLLGQALEGVRGVVTDIDGRPLAAAVEVVGHDVAADSSTVRTDPDVGDYHRLLLAGTYTLRFQAPGYLDAEVAGIAVTGGDATVVDVVLYSAATVTVTGTVTAPSGSGIGGATVEIAGASPPPASTGDDGVYLIDGVHEGTNTFRVSAPGYVALEAQRLVAPDAAVHDFVLQPRFRVVPTPVRLAPHELVVR